jgi:hypothetical protein
MATGTNPLGLGFSDPYPPKKNPLTGYPFSVTGRDFISKPNPSGNPPHIFNIVQPQVLSNNNTTQIIKYSSLYLANIVQPCNNTNYKFIAEV